MVSKIFEKLIIGLLLIARSVAFFANSQYCFGSSFSMADLLAVVSNIIARAFIRSGATQAVALNISKTFDRVWQAALFQELKSYEF